MLKSAELLVDSFDVLSIFFNPASAATGERVRCEPYKLLDKLAKIIETQGVRGPLGRVRIALLGRSYRAYDVYDSIMVIPMTLLDNALKYSFGDSVNVTVTDEALGTRIEVTNVGPLIGDDEMDRIFERSGRGRFAERIQAKGAGVGLFVAAAAAKANGTKIEVRSVRKGYERNGVPVADNAFSFVVRDSPGSGGKGA